ncbi:MAG: glutamine-hydrolyzing carbamoyl-phosphate synthase small subunit [Alphaproteobacteria bacterium]|nr:glutamine-hydrolyzing carbamoyl-phosphate synthase small subunit [Alphaproteobacteria bacterium]
MFSQQIPPQATAALVLADGSVFWGKGVGAPGTTGGEVCFNTAMTGYQEIMTDPSYAGQIITFTFPHVGNTGANDLDVETETPFAKGLILRADITGPSSWRAESHFNDWLKTNGLTGICGVDTRALTRHLRDKGAQNGVIHFAAEGETLNVEDLKRQAKALPAMTGQDIARTVTCKNIHAWTQGPWNADKDRYETLDNDAGPHVVVVDYGVKHNILRCLAAEGLRLTVVPCDTAADDILSLKPDGIFLSNGPGDPAATGVYAVPVVKELLESGLPLFGICLGHQILALSLGAKTEKLPFGHRGANHPVKDLETGKVEITSQNHGFHVIEDSLPDAAEPTHTSLFDGTNEGLRLKGRSVFSVQYHPEASPGPQDSHYLFARFANLLRESLRKTA